MPKIEKLPSIGEPLTIKTRKQGRTQKLDSLKREYSYTRKNAHGDMVDIKKLRLTCHTISKHPKATEGQKQFASELFDKETYTLREASIIYGIARKLRKL